MNMELFLENIVGMGEKGLTPEELKSKAEKIPGFLDKIDSKKQGFTELPRQKASVLAVKNLAEQKKGSFKDIVVLGIGGSALGVTCLRDSLKGPFWNTHGEPRLFVLDNPDLVYEVEKTIDPNKTLFVVISKSGGTIETVNMYRYFKEKVSKDNFVFITGEKGYLRESAEKLDIPVLDIPENVGGRFSVLSPVGLFPASLMGIDIENLLEGAEDALDFFYEEEFDMNLPFQIATVQYLLDWKHGIHISVMMPYSSLLSSFADWYRQLLAESIGKNGKGLTPVKALGVTDQHSQLQLYNEGPNDKFIFFIEVSNAGSRAASDPAHAIASSQAKSVSDTVSGAGFKKLMAAEKKATEEALKQYGKPNATLKIDEVDERTLGRLFMLFECSIAFLGEYYRINAFDQPGVELGKKLTKEILSKSK